MENALGGTTTATPCRTAVARSRRSTPSGAVPSWKGGTRKPRGPATARPSSGSSWDAREAVERCAVGIGLHPGIAELPWLAGFASRRAGRYRDAVAFSNLAIVHGEYCGLAGEIDRGLFRHLPALYEGPFDVLRYAYRALGEEPAADQAERDFLRTRT